MTLPILKLPVAEIEASSAVQVRTKIDKATVKDYVEALEAFAVFPPLTVFAESGSERYLLADGFHRLAAYREFGMAEVECQVHEGGLREALHYALSANSAHGLRRSNTDKRNAVMMALKDPEWLTWNNVKVGKLCAVSESLVRKVREELVVKGEIDELDTVKTERDGKTVEQKATAPRSHKTTSSNSAGKSTTKQLTDQQKKTAKGVRDSLKHEQQQREKPKPKTLEEKNAEDFFAGIAAARTACVADGRELVRRWQCHDRRDELVYLHGLLADMITEIDEAKAAA